MCLVSGALNDGPLRDDLGLVRRDPPVEDSQIRDAATGEEASLRAVGGAAYDPVPQVERPLRVDAAFDRPEELTGAVAFWLFEIAYWDLST